MEKDTNGQMHLMLRRGVGLHLKCCFLNANIIHDLFAFLLYRNPQWPWCPDDIHTGYRDAAAAQQRCN